MCVIIIIPKGCQISQNDLRACWDTNPDGAGYAFRKYGLVHYARGFMDFSSFWAAISKIQPKADLLLHLRISTSAGISQQGCHPYRSSNLLSLSGKTREPLYAMNGVISGQKLANLKGYKLNDTASYILAHSKAFKAANADLLEIIAEATMAKWAAISPSGYYMSPDFKEKDGIYYSNLNHDYLSLYLDFYDYSGSFDDDSSSCKDYSCGSQSSKDKGYLSLEHFISPELAEQAKNDFKLYTQLLDHIYFECEDFNCDSCRFCLSECKTLEDLRSFLSAHYFIRGWE